MASYSEAFKAEMVRKMLPPAAIAVRELAQETGVHHTTLSRWFLRVGKLDGMENEKTPRRPADWSVEEKMRAVLAAASLEGEELGSYLRRHGLHQTHLDQWRRQMLGGLSVPSRASKKNPEAKRIRTLEKELRRKEAALAETAALLVLSKKAHALWGDGDTNTTQKKGKKSSD